MPSDCPHRSPTVSALTRLPARGYFLLRPQLLTRISAFPRAGLSRRLTASLDRSCWTVDDVRPSAGSLARNVRHYQGIRALGHIW
jgi:hypothetical protein